MYVVQAGTASSGARYTYLGAGGTGDVNGKKAPDNRFNLLLIVDDLY